MGIEKRRESGRERSEENTRWKEKEGNTRD